MHLLIYTPVHPSHNKNLQFYHFFIVLNENFKFVSNLCTTFAVGNMINNLKLITIMKKILMFATAIILATTGTFAATCCVHDDDKPITFEELPAKTKEFVGKHFAKEQVSYVTLDNDIISKEYTLVFLSGTKLEFDGDGEWTEVDCRYSNVPAALVPDKIKEYVKAQYPQSKITELKREHGNWEAKITGGLELTFSSDYRLIDVDD